MSKLIDNWCVDWDRVKTVYKPFDELCAHWECPYKHCVYHKFYDPDRESTVNTPTTVREMRTCMMYLGM